MQVYVGIPMYGGTHGLFVRSLLSMQIDLVSKGHKVIFDIVSGGSILTKVRNGLVKRFIDSGSDVLLFLDSDMCFDSETIDKLINAPFDISVANYRKRNNEITYLANPVLVDGIPTGIVEGKDVWIRAENAGTGVMAIKRDTITTMMIEYPELTYIDQGIEYPCLFDFQLSHGQYFGEDYTFCQRAESAGKRIYILADCFIGHIGETVFGGNYHEYLRG